MAECTLRLQRATWSLDGAIAVLDKDFPAPQNESPHRNGGAAINQTAKRHAAVSFVGSADGHKRQVIVDADGKPTPVRPPNEREGQAGMLIDCHVDATRRLGQPSQVAQSRNTPHHLAASRASSACLAALTRPSCCGSGRNLFFSLATRSSLTTFSCVR